MIQIRNSVFETNSSSTHSIAIPKSVSEYSRYMQFEFGEFGWGEEEVDQLDYFYTALYELYSGEELQQHLNQLEDILSRHGIEYTMADRNISRFYNCAYIDNASNLRQLVDELFLDEDKLLRFLTCGLVFTSNDNGGTDGFIERDEEYIERYDWDLKQCVEEINPFYMKDADDYEWYYKGN